MLIILLKDSTVESHKSHPSMQHADTPTTYRQRSSTKQQQRQRQERAKREKKKKT